MSRYLFTGQFKASPIQNLSGTKKGASASLIIQDAKADRDRRETDRLRHRSSIIIQSWFKSYRCRRNAKLQVKNEFRNLPVTLNVATDPDKFGNCLSMLLFFYDSCDECRQLLLEFMSVVVKTKAAAFCNLANFDTIDICGQRQALHLRWWRFCRLIRLVCRVIPVWTCMDAAHGRPIVRFLEVVLAELADADVVYRLLTLTDLLPSLVALLVAAVDKTDSELTFSDNWLRRRPQEAAVLGLIWLVIARCRSLPYDPAWRHVGRLAFSALLCNAPVSQTLLVPYLRRALASDEGELRRLLLSGVVEAAEEREGSAQAAAAGGLQPVLSLLQLCVSSDGPVIVDRRLLRVVGHLLSGALQHRRASRAAAADTVTDSDSDTDQPQSPLDDEPYWAAVRQVLVGDRFGCAVEQLVLADETGDVLNDVSVLVHLLLRELRVLTRSCQLLLHLAMDGPLLRRWWAGLQLLPTAPSPQQLTFNAPRIPLCRAFAQRLPLSPHDNRRLVHHITAFAHLLTVHIATVSAELFSPEQLVALVQLMRDIVITAIHECFACRPARFELTTSVSVVRQADWQSVIEMASNLLRLLYERQCISEFCAPHTWLSAAVHVAPTSLGVRAAAMFDALQTVHNIDDVIEYPDISESERRTIVILLYIPFTAPFGDRLLLFRRALELNSKADDRMHSVTIRIRRDFIYEDALSQLAATSFPNMRTSFRLHLIDFHGLEEVAIDGGGPYREFMNEFVRVAYDARRGFFTRTEEGFLYPNPDALLMYTDAAKHFEFLGRMLGKAIFSKLRVELPLAPFFLSKLLSREGNVERHHLASLDSTLYRNLSALLTTSEDVSSYDLTFSVVTERLGHVDEMDLKRNGRNVGVTNATRHEYVMLLADWYLNRRIRIQTAAFRQGVQQVLPLSLLRLFAPKELTDIICGIDRAIDVDDLRRNTVYAAGYNEQHLTIVLFWEVVRSFDHDQRQRLLKFCTSCSRPPLLGFQELVPKFCIQCAGNDVTKLPTASTCVNLLKLPAYQDSHLLREKLLCAIDQPTGFGFS